MDRINVSDAQIWQHMRNLRALCEMPSDMLATLDTKEAKFALKLHMYHAQHLDLLKQEAKRFYDYAVMGAEVACDIWEKEKKRPNAPKSFFNISYFMVEKNVLPGITDTGMLGFFGSQGQLAIAGYFTKADNKLLSVEMKEFCTYAFCESVFNTFCTLANDFLTLYEEQEGK